MAKKQVITVTNVERTNEEMAKALAQLIDQLLVDKTSLIKLMKLTSSSYASSNSAIAAAAASPTTTTNKPPSLAAAMQQ